MPRTDIVAKDLTGLGGYPALPLAATAADFVWAAADIVNNNSCTLTGREILLVNNTGAGTGTVTINSAPDERQRVGDIVTYTVGIGLFSVFGPFPVLGWRQADGKLYFQGSAVTMKFALLRLVSGSV